MFAIFKAGSVPVMPASVGLSRPATVPAGGRNPVALKVRSFMSSVATCVWMCTALPYAHAQCAGCGADFYRADRQRVDNQERPAFQGYVPNQPSNTNEDRALKQLDNE